MTTERDRRAKVAFPANGRRSTLSLGTFGLVAAFAASLHLAFWAIRDPATTAPSIEEPLPSVSYNRFADPRAQAADVLERQIRADLTVLATKTRAVRTYSSTHGLELVPKIAAELGLTVSLGIWISKDSVSNEREIRSGLDLARLYPNVRRLIVGNETMFRREQTPDSLIAIVRRVKRESPVPVATADHWIFFLDNPQLVDVVDQVFAHFLPYWEGDPRATAVDRSLARYDHLVSTYPNKPIVIGEFGWPSEGHNFRRAVPDPIGQAVILRNFVDRANARSLDYNIVEGIDQPQKLFEGDVGPYWGIFDASLRPKFPWTGPIADARYWKAASIAVAIGVLLSLTILLLPGVTVPQAILLAGVNHFFGHWCTSVLLYWENHYLLRGEAICFAIAVPMLGFLAPILRSRINEIAVVTLGSEPEKLLGYATSMSSAYTPRVSIHIPAYREPPEMLIKTIDSVARLDYPDFECVVVINNTPDPAMWQPVEARCRELGPRFKFVCVQNLVGFKAAALRIAIAETAANVEIIGVLDADYVVDAAWLKDLVPSFTDPDVGFVQAPQDHRDECRSFVHAAMNAEYAGFFDVGMVERNEFDAIVMHGTMCLIRRTALASAGGWSSDTICEDSDLGLSMMELGWRARYTARRYGWGLLPQDYVAFRTQRARWAAGAVQIIRKHWRKFLPGASKLDRDQKREFVVGWLAWLGAEVVAVASAFLNLVWTPLVAFQEVAIPDTLLTLPILVACFVSGAQFVSAYRLRVLASYREMFGAMLVSMSLQWTLASAAVKASFSGRNLYFHRTRKGSGTVLQAPLAALPEALVGSLLLVSSGIVYATNLHRYLDIDVFATILFVQGLPFLAAVAVVCLERAGQQRVAGPALGAG